MNKSLLLALVASSVLATGAFAQSSGTDTNSPTVTTGKAGTPVITPGTSGSTETSGSSASGNMESPGSSTSQDLNVAGQNPNPNIYGGNRGNTQQDHGGNRYSQQYQNQGENAGQGMNPWAYYGGHHAMMQEMMQASMMQPGMGMVCMTPAPNAQGPGVPGSFACFPQHQTGQGMGMGMGMGSGMGQYGFNPYGRNFDDSQRYGENQRGYNPNGGNPEYNQHGQNFGSGIPYGSGRQYGVNDGMGATSPNWYYENRQRQFSRSNEDFDRERYGSSRNSNEDGRSNRYNSDTATGSMSRPNSNAGGSDYRSNDYSSQPYYDDQRSD